MPTELFINSDNFETRIALVENGTISELYIERNKHKSIVGNIYKGRVLNILPGLQSAFIDIGKQRAAFLHITDISFIKRDFTSIGPENVTEDMDEELDFGNRKGENINQDLIEEFLKKDDDILVQVTKESIEQKGARVTTYITIPGRYLVLMPDIEHIGISRKITDNDEIERLKSILTEIKPNNFGLIARTASYGVSKDELIKDLEYLLKVWENTLINYKNAESPELVYEEQDLLFKTLRDIFSKEISRIVVDNERDYQRIKNFIDKYISGVNVDVELYTGSIPLFEEYYNLEIEINRLSERKIWLRSGGTIVIDQCEALTAIDVNTGKYKGGSDFESTIFKTNIEAAKEIAYQIILRNIGGIIIIDFIDMADKENEEKVLCTLKEELKRDRLKSTVINITPLGLVEITRKRVQDSITRFLTESCPYCEGMGRVKSKPTITYEILRKLIKFSSQNTNKNIILEAHPDIIDFLINNEKEVLNEIEQKYNKVVVIKGNDCNHIEEYNIKVNS
jgi:ribonuclease G